MKEIVIMIDKPMQETIIKKLPSYALDNWKHIERLHFEKNDYIEGELIIPCSGDSWRKGFLEIGNNGTIRSIKKEYLSIEEREEILEDFYRKVLTPFVRDNPDVKIIME